MKIFRDVLKVVSSNGKRLVPVFSIFIVVAISMTVSVPRTEANDSGSSSGVIGTSLSLYEGNALAPLSGGLSASDPTSTYDFKDNENNRAWYYSGNSWTPDLTPDQVPGSVMPASPEGYDNLKNSDNQRWISHNGGDYDQQYYMFDIQESLSSIDNFKVMWEGFGWDGLNVCYFWLYIWNLNTTDWEEIDAYHPEAGEHPVDITLSWENNQPSNYIADNGELWLCLSSETLSSTCPILYAWNGESYEFVADVSTNGGLGFSDENGIPRPPQPLDYATIEDSQLEPENGVYKLIVAEDQDEITYFDFGELTKIYHSRGTRLLSGTVIYQTWSYPPPELHTVRDPRPPVAAWDESGVSVLELIAREDGEVFGQDSHGYDRLVLDLGDLSDAEQIKLVLKARTSWVNVPPWGASYAEVPGENGDWVRVDEPFPEFTFHNTRTYAIDITDWFKTDNYMLRFNDWHRKTYDWIAVDTSPDEWFYRSELDLRSAELFNKGISPSADGVYYYYEAHGGVSRKYVGNFTRYGDVTELVGEADDKFVIMPPGDAIELEFNEKFNPLDLFALFGLVERSYIFVSDAYYKMDFVKWLLGESISKVEPLPFHGMSYYPYPEDESFPWDEEHLDWWGEYQTRYIAPPEEGGENHNTLYTDYLKADVTYTLAPSAPSLVSPADGTCTNDNTPTFEWICGENADNHRLLVDNDPDFSSPEDNVLLGATDNTYTPASENSLPDDNYSWKVVAINAAGENESGIWTFVIDTVAPPAPSLGIPENNAVDNLVVAEDFTWENLDPIENTTPVLYQILIDDDPNFGSPDNDSGWQSDNSWTATLQNGKWYWKVRAKDNAGNIGSWSDVRNKTVDTVAPPAPSLGIPDNNTIDNLATEDFTWENLDPIENTTPVLYQILIDDNPNFSSPENDSGWQSDNSWTAVLQDGKWYWKVRAKDNAGNAGNWSGVRNKTVDTVAPPAPSLGIPENNAVDNLVVAEDFTWENLDPIENTTPVVYQILIDNNSDFSSPENDSGWQSDNSWTATLQNGKWYWKVRAKDNAGNAGNWSGVRNKTVDTVAPPAPSLGIPENNTIDNLATEDFTWENLDPIENTTPVVYQILIDDNSDFSSPENDSGWQSDNSWTAVLQDGKWYWKVRARDNAGNAGNWSGVRNKTVDTVAPPAPSLLEPKNNAYESDSTPTFRWTEPVVPENYILVIDNDSDFSSPAKTIADLTDNTHTLTTPLSDDVYYWRVREIDQAGNPGAWANSFKLTIDTSAPGAPASLAASPSGWTNTNSFTVSWTKPSDLSGIAGAYYKLDSAPTSQTDGTYVVGTGLTSISSISVSGDGSHPVYVWLKDRAGNVDHDNRNSTTLYLDTTAPGITLSPSLATEMTVSSSSIKISGTVSDLTGVTIMVNGKVVSAMDSSFSYTVDLRVGPNTITITAVDTVGNASSISLRVTRTAAGAPAPQPTFPAEQAAVIIMVGAALGIALFAVVLMKRH